MKHNYTTFIPNDIMRQYAHPFMIAVNIKDGFTTKEKADRILQEACNDKGMNAEDFNYLGVKVVVENKESDEWNYMDWYPSKSEIESAGGEWKLYKSHVYYLKREVVKKLPYKVRLPKGAKDIKITKDSHLSYNLTSCPENICLFPVYGFKIDKIDYNEDNVVVSITSKGGLR